MSATKILSESIVNVFVEKGGLTLGTRFSRPRDVAVADAGDKI